MVIHAASFKYNTSDSWISQCVLKRSTGILKNSRKNIFYRVQNYGECNYSIVFTLLSRGKNS